jgi:hypothetical protein
LGGGKKVLRLIRHSRKKRKNFIKGRGKRMERKRSNSKRWEKKGVEEWT